VLHKLRDEGNTVVVIEHNLDVIKTADWIVDLGPEGGHRGGTILVTGTPEDVAACPQSYTGQFLAACCRPPARARNSRPPWPTSPTPARRAR
jgi:excinuclease ABC subunit A